MDWKVLISNLDSQAEKHEELLSMLEEEGNSSPSVSSEKLEQFNANKGRLIDTLSSLEKGRQKILQSGFPEEFGQNLSLEYLLGRVSEPVIRDSLSKRKQILNDLIKAIRRQNNRNRQMIRARKEVFRSLHDELKIKLNSLNSTQLYSAKGQTIQTKTSNLLHQRV